MSPVRLAARLARQRGRGERVVFTNGCFDLLHAGHVVLLEKARALGDCLVVGLNSDASVRRLKGRGRPLAPLADRLKVLAALESVDYVTVFGEDTPVALIRKLRPSILVKGGDYTFTQIVGRDLVKRVVRIPLVTGRSTSALVQKIIKAYGR
jgi:rfaE bifunctional protein nucleotidyltransferase chain/domain